MIGSNDFIHIFFTHMKTMRIVSQLCEVVHNQMFTFWWFLLQA